MQRLSKRLLHRALRQVAIMSISINGLHLPRTNYHTILPHGSRNILLSAARNMALHPVPMCAVV